MGGDYYDRVDVWDGASASQIDGAEAGDASAYSAQAEQVLKKSFLHSDLDPRGKRLVCDAETPIVIAIDVTGSMGDWAKIMWDKLPMFFGQLRMHGYCEGPAISFAGIGDAPAGDSAPLQVGDFAAGGALDGVISKMWLEGLGGGNQRESYDLAAYFYLSDRVKFTGLRPGQKPFLFITGDEGVYETVDKEVVRRWVDKEADAVVDPGRPTRRVLAALPADLEPGVCRVRLDLPGGDAVTADLPPGASAGQEVELEVEFRSWSSQTVFGALCRRYHVFHVHKAYHSKAEEKIFAQWARLVGPDRVLTLENPKAIADLMLGAIAVTNGIVTLEEYAEEMEQRGQDEKRIEEVMRALSSVQKWNGETSKAAETEPVRALKVSACSGLEAVGLELQKRIAEFRDGGAPNSTLALPAGLSDWQKRQLHQFATKSGIISKSVGEGAARHITLTQPNVPVRFSDPLTRELMEDPVIGPDGYSYERETIVTWLRTHDKSPITGAPLPHKDIESHVQLKSEIATWRAKHGR